MLCGPGYMCVVCSRMQGTAWLGLTETGKLSDGCVELRRQGKSWLGLAVTGRPSDGCVLVCDHEDKRTRYIDLSLDKNNNRE